MALVRGVRAASSWATVTRNPSAAVVATCQDGGVVTAILCHGLREGLFDGACVSAADETLPAAPKPKVVTTVAEAITSASSWYTYCPNDLALADA